MQSGETTTGLEAVRYAKKIMVSTSTPFFYWSQILCRILFSKVFATVAAPDSNKVRKPDQIEPTTTDCWVCDQEYPFFVKQWFSSVQSRL